METRAEYFISEFQGKFEELIRDEMKLRANAAQDLAEPFAVNGVIIQPACHIDGTIDIIKGYDAILKAFGLTRETVITEKHIVTNDRGNEYEEFIFELPDIQGKFRYTDTECPITKEKVMPYD